MTGFVKYYVWARWIFFGTGSFQVLLDINEVSKMEAKSLEKKINIDDMLKIEDDNAFCSKNNIKINDNTNLITGENSGFIVDDYDMRILSKIYYIYIIIYVATKIFIIKR